MLHLLPSSTRADTTTPAGVERCSQGSLPVPQRPSPVWRRVGSRDYCFGACPVLACASARVVAGLLMQPFVTRVLQSTSLPP